MGINPSLAGRVYPPSPAYEVSREKIAEFATAIGSGDPAHTDPGAARALGHPDVIAPPTFAVIMAQRAEAQIYADPASGVDFSRLVHGEERFTHHRPVVAGDRLTATLHVDGVREVGGNGLLTTRVELTDADGVPVSTVRSTVVVRGEE
ncbi:MAG TPA: MaoC family dehydratase N-terminal domain-containing protein [Kineosporiaceae bacterium]